jgi:site-specific DNA recombinase
VIGHYVTLRLPDSFRQEVREQLEEAVADDQTSTRELHAALTRRLKELDERESRLIDLAADASLPQAKIRAKLHEIQRERDRAHAGLTNTGEELAVGAAVLRDALHLVEDPQRLYHDVADDIRRHLNQTFYERFYIDDLEVAGDEKTPLFTEIHQAATDYNRPPQKDQQESPRNAEAFLSTSTDRLTLSDLFSVKVSSKAVMVGRAGLKPATNGLWVCSRPPKSLLDGRASCAVDPLRHSLCVLNRCHSIPLKESEKSTVPIESVAAGHAKPQGIWRVCRWLLFGCC